MYSRLIVSLLLGSVGFSSSSPVLENIHAGAITGTKYIISFGDSYTQSGFDINGAKPSALNPFGNPEFPGWTTSGGINWLGHLCRTYNTSLTLAFNFAAGGATVDANLVSSITTISLVEQVSQFTSSLSSKPSYAPWTSDNTLFAVWMGVNDVGNTFGGNSNATETALLNKIVAQYQAMAQKMYDSGGRNFAFLTVPPIQKSPTMLSQSASSRATEADVIAAFNSLIAKMTASFLASHTEAKAVVVDTVAVFDKLLANPTIYGAGQNGATCYNSDGKSCLWWNDYHPGLAIHKAVAEAVAGGFKGRFF
ncbi:putative 1,4-beta-D-glucan cellobiohydrolase C [Venustampulla echinocandica]|uniref:Putative 1,4-beta-D-glucan cellobiohydrolase C n=1 Tax=Venustampulla echinocandica TaxID=2656787 RepID=A0A370TZC0_9HELO|nr:putative 1,4-beta-D-glucan cellobiohydrolase C [Venustampulla echinocandica]RDL40877.1 putative 1,4-beta-D-glucan cellobiohydrolase C [Venustampulla echinocandica]